ncbi:MAG TPA: DUF4347 domain-containing protein, partial [Candidatus Polarisedimenticolia bacterium]|nr:DUF4347 domain-containing protein [Candidatus Polarisedimenticolia bacterium]
MTGARTIRNSSAVGPSLRRGPAHPDPDRRPVRLRRRLQRIVLPFALATSLTAPCLAATFTVDSTADVQDANPGDGICSTAGGACTLRAALSEANQLNGADTVILPSGTYLATLTGSFEDNNVGLNATGPAGAAAGHVSRTRELVLIDAEIQDLDTLVERFLARDNQSRDVTVVLLDPSLDGFAQVDAALAGDGLFDAIHFVTHGSDGMIRLGGSWLDATTIEQRKAEIQGWAESLTDRADLLFYGCNFAADAVGQTVVDRLAELTGADVAASADNTGSAARGGDWQLEYRVGVIDTPITLEEGLAGWEHLLNTYPVTNTNDSGGGSLRQAITDANGNPGLDTISFNIAGAGVHTITPTSELPDITDPVVVDATSQPGYAGTPLIELDGTSAGNNKNGLRLFIGSDGSTIRGLAINRFGNIGIQIYKSGGHRIEDNFIGTDPSGTIARGNKFYGMELSFDAANNVIVNNVISANDTGIIIDDAAADGNVIQGNKFGTDVTGTIALGNATAGINVGFGANSNLIGGLTAGQANVIAFNGTGIQVVQNSTTGNSILGNSIFSNGSLGIDLGTSGVNANDAGDVDNGPNGLQNFPVLTSATSSGGNTTIAGSLNSTAGTTFRIEFFSSPTGDISGFGEGQTYLGSTTVTTDGGGNAAFNTTLAGVSVTNGYVVSATATVDLGGGTYGSTSEFAANVTVSTAAADLSLTKTVSNPTPNVGSNVTFTLTVSNAGPSGATGVSVSDLLPSGFTYVSDTGGGSYNSGTGLWTVGSVAAAGSATLTITATVNASGSYTNGAQVQASGQADPDSTPGNGVGNGEDDQASVTLTPVAVADLSLTKSASSLTPNVGSNVTFTITVSNAGPSGATGVTVTDLLPAGFSFVSSAGPGTYNSGTGLWTIGAIANAGSATLTITATVLASGSYTNGAQVQASGQTDPDSTPGNGVGNGEDDQASVTLTPVAVADLSLTKTASNPTPNVGSNVTF